MDRDTAAATTNHRSFYTDLTRAKYEAVIYTNDRRALPKSILRQSEKAAALDVVPARTRANIGSVQKTPAAPPPGAAAGPQVGL